MNKFAFFVNLCANPKNLFDDLQEKRRQKTTFNMMCA